MEHANETQFILDTLGPLVSEERKKRIDRVLQTRTRSLTCVLDQLYDHGNASAVMRSCESYGISQLHIVHNRENKFKKANRSAQGAHKWLELKRWLCPTECAAFLKEEGYQIITTELEAETSLHEVDFSLPTALVFGGEKKGVCDEIGKLADKRVYIPMHGFTQSFNISVAAALAIDQAFRSRCERLGTSGDLSAVEKKALTAKYFMKSVDRAAEILQASRIR